MSAAEETGLAILVFESGLASDTSYHTLTQAHCNAARQAFWAWDEVHVVVTSVAQSTLATVTSGLTLGSALKYAATFS